MKAVWQDKVVAEAPKEELIYIEGNWYFPPASVNKKTLQASATPYTCPWKGVCQYYNVGENEVWSHDAAWAYPEPKPTAITRVGKDFSGYVAFWRDVKMSE